MGLVVVGVYPRSETCQAEDVIALRTRREVRLVERIFTDATVFEGLNIAEKVCFGGEVLKA